MTTGVGDDDGAAVVGAAAGDEASSDGLGEDDATGRGERLRTGAGDGDGSSAAELGEASLGDGSCSLGDGSGINGSDVASADGDGLASCCDAAAAPGVSTTPTAIASATSGRRSTRRNLVPRTPSLRPNARSAR